MPGFLVWVKVFWYNNDFPCVKQGPVFMQVIMEQKDFDEFRDNDIYSSLEYSREICPLWESFFMAFYKPTYA